MGTSFICTSGQVSEDGYDSKPGKQKRDGIRTELLNSYNVGQTLYDTFGSAIHRMSNLGALMWYADLHPDHKKRRRMNVDKMVQRWVPVVSGLATAHDKDALDDYESQIDNLLGPLLTAPVAQLREFSDKLLVALKADRSVPFLVWRAFEVWFERTVKPAPDEGVVKLKTELATEIAKMVEPQIQGDLVQALIGALQWRSEEQLVEIKTAVAAGGKPRAKTRIVGRQSCLFLSVPRGRGRKPAEVML